jgi:drug/metabolite transporter (DMT)-like permease
MIRLLAGLFLVLGAVGGIEQFDLNYTIGFLFGVVGLILMVSPINDGSLDHYLEK